MEWKWNSSSHPISDIRDWRNANRLEIRPDFQRRAVWSDAARMLLMDTIMRNIPMPKIFLQAVIRESDTYRVIIDGQQRIKAILAFLDDDYSLSKPYVGEYQNKKFSELPSSVQEDILAYKIDVNEIRNASDEVVRDIYSRVNKYTVALNKQELRRADYPGHFLHLSEELAQVPFFEDGKVFTISNSKRMGDVEFVSELLALLIAGPQEKRDTLDSFYLKYTQWEDSEKSRIKERFKNVLEDIEKIWSEDCPGAKDFSQSRFRQKADFYSLFAAIDDCLYSGNTLNDKPLVYLRQDLQIIDDNTEPESEVGVLSKYAVQCVSQANSLGSRKWRRDFLKLCIGGTYFAKPPDISGVQLFHELLWDLYTPSMCPAAVSTCPVCGVEDIDNYSTENVFLTWKRDSLVFHLSNAEFVHNDCKSTAEKEYYVWKDPYSVVSYLDKR